MTIVLFDSMQQKDDKEKKKHAVEMTDELLL
jgi:hypothetical protein